MEMTLQSTSKIVEIDSVPARVWEGVSARGIPVRAYINRVVAKRSDDSQAFQLELQEHTAPSAVVAALPTHITLKGRP